MDNETFMRGVLGAMREAGFPPDFVYAFEKTGLFVTKENKHLFSKTCESGRRALGEWRRMHPDETDGG